MFLPCFSSAFIKFYVSLISFYFSVEKFSKFQLKKISKYHLIHASLIIRRFRIWQFSSPLKFMNLQSVSVALQWPFVDICGLEKNQSSTWTFLARRNKAMPCLPVPAEMVNKHPLRDLFRATVFKSVCFMLVILLFKMSPALSARRLWCALWRKHVC